MTIDNERIDKSTVVLTLAGRLDTANAPLLERKLKQWGNDITEIVLDFKELEYISSMGLRVLLQAIKTMKSENRSLPIINMRDSVREVFEMTGFINVMVQEEKFVVIRSDESDSIVLSFNGELKIGNTTAVSDELVKIKSQHGKKSVNVILNMENLTSISLAAVKYLNQVIADTAWPDRKIHIRNAAGDVLTYLRTQEGLDELIEN
ncbi:MAG: STAS domain-containing protein [Treponema sp.]|nr:STAS domain-containing protein [Treponema sp.]